MLQACEGVGCPIDYPTYPNVGCLFFFARGHASDIKLVQDHIPCDRTLVWGGMILLTGHTYRMCVMPFGKDGRSPYSAVLILISKIPSQ